MTSWPPATAPSGIVIGIATCNRPTGLARLLDSIQRDLSGTPFGPLLIVVCDNHPNRAGKPVVTQYADVLPMRYVIETQRGLAHARNHILAETDGYSAVLFVDDDEAVKPGWLSAFTNAHATDPGALVFGPVHTVPKARTSRWRVELYDTIAGRRKFGDGYLSHENVLLLGDGNTLLPLSTLGEKRYSPDFAGTGCQDTELFTRLLPEGARGLFVNAAAADELVAPNRLRISYLVGRSANNGINWSRINSRPNTLRRKLTSLATALAICITSTLSPVIRRSRYRGLGTRRGLFQWIASVSWAAGYARQTVGLLLNPPT